jgi:L-arabinokinase
VIVTAPGEALRDLPAGVLGLSEEVMYGRGLRYEDLVAAVDAVVSKPGYGIIADCAAGGTPLAYTSRGRFPEYDVLVREMPRYVRSAFVPMDALLEGRWLAGLEAAAAAPPPPARELDGAAVVARLIAERLEAT